MGESTFSGDNTLGEHFFQGRTLLGENFFCKDLTVLSGGESTRRHFPGLGPRAGAEAGAEIDKGFISVMFDQFNVRDITKKVLLNLLNWRDYVKNTMAHQDLFVILAGS